MKTKSLMFAAMFAGVSLFSIACGQKKDPSEAAFDTLTQCVPADVVAFAGGYISLDEQKKAQERGDWKKVVSALKQNPAIAEFVAKSFDADTDVKYFIERWLGGTDVIDVISEACEVAPAPTAFVAYIDDGDRELKEGEIPEFALAVTMSEKYVKSVSHFLYCLKREHEERGKGKGVWNSKTDGEKTIYTYKEDNAICSIALWGDDMLVSVSQSEEGLSKLENTFANPSGNPLKDSPAFQKAAKGVGEYNFVGFFNFDELNGFRTPNADDEPTEKIFKETAESIAVFVDMPFGGNAATALARMEFSKPLCVHEALTSMAKNKLSTLANAIPGADYAIGIAFPELTQELADDAKIPAEELEKIRRLDPKNLYLSVSDIEKLAGLFSGDYMSLPQVFAKIECGDNSVLSEEKNIAPFFDGSNPMAVKRNINGTDVYSFMIFSVNYALLGKTGLYVSNLFDASEALALAQGTGKSLEQEGTFNALAEKLSGENALEVFSDDRAGIRAQIAFMERQANTPELPKEMCDAARMSVNCQKLLLDLTKKSLSGLALRRNGTAIELHWSCDFEYDFDAFAEGIKNLK